jgi:DNA (cytosine-5)-methyltransferase 1
MAGFDHAACIEIDRHACATLSKNRPEWNVLSMDVHNVHGKEFPAIDLLAGGVPCPPFSIAGKQLGSDDDRDLFPAALRLVQEARPSAVMLENVRGLMGARFEVYRQSIIDRLEDMGYKVFWKVLQAGDYGVPQLRPRSVLVALKPKAAKLFRWPEPEEEVVTVGKALFKMMAARGWPGAKDWAERANEIAPTLVGGSKKHGGADLGPTRAKAKWAAMGVDGMGLADEAPGPDFPIDGKPRLTVDMAARIQGFPPGWHFTGGKTAAYRQVGNAFPPPVAAAVGAAIRDAVLGAKAKPEPAKAKSNG